EGAVLGIHRRQPVLVDQHGLVREPRGPGALADAGEHALAEFARPWHEVEAFGVALFVFAVDDAAHGWCSWGVSNCASMSVRTGAGMPRPASASSGTQRSWSLSRTAVALATWCQRRGCMLKR